MEGKWIEGGMDGWMGWGEDRCNSILPLGRLFPAFPTPSFLNLFSTNNTTDEGEPDSPV